MGREWVGRVWRADEENSLREGVGGVEGMGECREWQVWWERRSEVGREEGG